MSEKDLKQAASVYYGVSKFEVKAEQEFEKKYRRYNSESGGTVNYKAIGGDNSIVVAGNTFNRTAFDEWLKSTERPGTLRDIRKRLAPIWTLANESIAAANLETAFDEYRARNGGNVLDDSRPEKQPTSYSVTIRPETMLLGDDGESAGYAGDLYWVFEARTYSPKTGEYSDYADPPFHQRPKTDYVEVDNGVTYYFKSQKHIPLEVKPGHQLELKGLVTDDDDGGDHAVVSFTSDKIDIKPGEQTISINSPSVFYKGYTQKLVFKINIVAEFF